MKKISRRELARMAAALGTATAARALPIAAQDRPSGYIGPLTGITKDIDDRRFDPVAYTRDRYAAAPAACASTRARASRPRRGRRRFARRSPSSSAAFRPSASLSCRSRSRRARFRHAAARKSSSTAVPGVSVLAYLLLPQRAQSPAPTMICVPGHGRGVDDIVGIDDQGLDRTDKAGYQHDFAIQVAEAGMAAVAIEPMGFGCRRDPINARQGLSRKACEPAAGGALLVGETMVAWRVWDVMRTLDYIATRTELDSSRVGCMGISGGGTVTVFATALEPRLRVALVSGYLNTFRDSIGSLAHCIDNYVPGILNWAEMHDVAGLIAPRPLFVESGEKDDIFPIQASIASFNHVREIYDVFQAGVGIEQEVFPGEHSFWGKRGIPFLARHLSA